VDVLLEAVDSLGQMGEAVGPGFSAWYAEHAEGVAHLLERLRATVRGEHVESSPVKSIPTPGAEAPLPEPLAAEESTEEPEEEDEARQPLLELFRTELTAHAQTLREGLGRLEQETEIGSLLEPLLRAACWVRSAAHIVHIKSAARLAQAVEMRLLAVQSSRQPPSSEDRAVLCRAVDLLPALGTAAVGPNLSTWLAEHEEKIASLIGELQTVARSQPVREKPSLPAPRSTELVPAARDESAGAARMPVPAQEAEQVVRVSAQNLTRLMGLAGEALVQARWLQAFSPLLLRLKRRQARLGETLDELGQSLPAVRSGGMREPTVSQTLLSKAREELSHCWMELDDRISEFEDHAREADNLNSKLYREVLASRMRPFGDGVHGFPRLVRDLARQLGKKIRFEIVGESVEVDRDILEKLEAPLGHLLRNALDHGLETPEERLAAGKPETGSLRIEARHSAGMLSIQVRDDGRGISAARIRKKVVDRKMASSVMAAGLREDELLEFLFLPGFSTAEQVTAVSGRGVGLDVVQSMVRAVGGTVRITSQLGRGASFHLQLPVTLSVIRAVLTEIADEPYAFPHNRINRLLRLPRAELGSLQNRQFFEVDGRNVGVVLGRQVLELAGDLRAEADLCVVLFGEGEQEFGLVADRFLGEQDLVVRPLDARLGKVPNISSAAILEDGAPVLIVDVEDLGRSIHKLLQTGPLQRADRPTGQEVRSRRRLLVVDDSITVREVQRQLLAGRGYEVEVAVDGMDGWNIVRRGGFDLVISDVDMPRLDGLGLVRLIKADPQLQGTPCRHRVVQGSRGASSGRPGGRRRLLLDQE